MDYVSRVRAGEEQNHDDQILNIAARTVALATGWISMPELGAADLWRTSFGTRCSPLLK